MKELILKLNFYIVNPLITLLFVIAVLVFIYGIIEFLRNRDVDADKANTGKNHILWGLIGIFFMVAAFSIMSFIAGSIGSTIPTP